ncbi:biotin-independent malonate decarboxylase subunit gamma [Lichenifustis flavocetrariae]|uniref:Biotin-independent malonate decarboxylase subunit gamma n=1 Tax=Lichenifustis flavocetrariae TaxID=2949735 RepID=A0AA41Z819_9HYPH|nr:biotin-independent malonate decarboxylase subunit gamma [Lichenifustis flavocetrariae]MCW6512218.1 biotin-independent malonate decarboxylase subunit gamma [Lichenifustis flavocetrariae]
MGLDDILVSLFPFGHDVVVADDGLILGSGFFAAERLAEVVGLAKRTALGVEGALALAGRLLEILGRSPEGPILVLLDSDSQRMSKRDELLGLNEFLAHLAKALILADLNGIPTIGVLYGHTAAGAFIATALATRILVALPDAEPEVMDLPSMARITKLPLAVLQDKARDTPVFAPGLANLAQTGAVHKTWNPSESLSAQLQELLMQLDPGGDRRDILGRERNGRPKAAEIASRVEALARSYA